MIDVWHYPLKDDAKLRREILSEYFGGEAFKLLKTDLGQPYARSKSGILSFSVTHTDKDCFLVVSTRGLPVGVDAESKTRKIQGENILERCGSSRERSKFKRLKTQREKNTFALRAWVLKEAVGKMLGVGVKKALFQQIDFVSASKAKGSFPLRSIQGELEVHYQWIRHPKYWVIVVSILSV